MCFFLVFSVPGREKPEVPPHLERCVHLVRTKNRAILRLSPEEWSSYFVTSGGCSCALYRPGQTAKKEGNRLAEKYRKKGWSEAKIHRAIRNRPNRELARSGLQPPIPELVAEMTSAHGRVRVTLHWFSGNVEEEDGFEPTDCGQSSLERFAWEGAGTFRSETTLVVAKAAP